MNFLKKNTKVIVAFILGLLLAGGIVFASGEYLASQVDYKDNKTVEDALDDLYEKIPSGEETITSNGNYDISNKASVQVNVTTVAGTKTLLWTNSSPNSTLTAFDITLSSSIDNFSHILIQYKVNTTSTDIYEDLFKVTPERPNENCANKGTFALGGWSNGEGLVNRQLRMTDSTTLRGGNAYRASR